jgi:hypothetical protein
MSARRPNADDSKRQRVAFMQSFVDLVSCSSVERQLLMVQREKKRLLEKQEVERNTIQYDLIVCCSVCVCFTISVCLCASTERETSLGAVGRSRAHRITIASNANTPLLFLKSLDNRFRQRNRSRCSFGSRCDTTMTMTMSLKRSPRKASPAVEQQQLDAQLQHALAAPPAALDVSYDNTRPARARSLSLSLDHTITASSARCDASDDGAACACAAFCTPTALAARASNTTAPSHAWLRATFVSFFSGNVFVVMLFRSLFRVRCALSTVVVHRRATKMLMHAMVTDVPVNRVDAQVGFSKCLTMFMS